MACVLGAALSNGSGTARKLFLGFGALVLVCAASSYLTIAGLGKIHAAFDQMKGEEERVRLALVARLREAKLLDGVQVEIEGAAIARAHGGDIEASNQSGSGAVFTLRLPRQEGTG
jgi:hypothetical protein